MNVRRYLILALLLSSMASTAAVGDRQSVGFASARLAAVPMTDPNLAAYEMVMITLDLAPGGYDSQPHRHEADVYGVVLEGAVAVELNGKPIGTFARGQVFTEPYNVVHSAIRNASATAPAKVLVLLPLKKGRALYTPVTDAEQ